MAYYRNMYLVVVGILALVLTLSRPIYPLIRGTEATLAAAAGVTLLPALVGGIVARRVLRQLDRHPHQPSRGQAAFGRGLTIVQMLLAAGHGGLLLTSDWLPLTAALPVIGRWVLVPGLVALVPFILSILLVWIAVYPADRAVRQIALEVYLFRGKPLRPVWPLLPYLIYNLRHQVLFILIPMLLILTAHDIIVLYQVPIARWTRLEAAPDVLIGLAAIAVAIFTPEILRHVWATQRLPDGPLRDRLLRLGRRLRLRCRDILVWRTGGLVVNAAVMGVVAPLRYVLITDGMLEQMEDTKIEAVFGHEAGHVKRHHIFYFLLFAFISGCAVTIFTIRTHTLAHRDPDLYQALALLLGTLLAMKWGLLFGWISRRFERQADIFGVRTLAVAGLPCSAPCAVHQPADDPPAPASDAVCTTAAHIFGDALHEVALLNGIRPEARSWRHSSIASRSRFLQELALYPWRLRRFERGVGLVKGLILAVTVVAGTWAAYDLRLWQALIVWLPR
ncbi:MAG: M48 family metalloprotease [Planctomycetota bacterium]